LEDISTYSTLKEEHVEHMKWVIKHFLEAGLYLNLEKCECRQETVKYLGLVIIKKGISMEENKVDTVLNWRQQKQAANGRLNNVFEVEQFPRFRN